METGGDRPKMITCPDCGKEFSRRYNMERHRDTQHATHSGPTEVEDCSLPPPNMADTKTGEQGKAWFGVL